MESQLLGPVRLIRDGGTVGVSTRKRRFVLAVLALQPNHLVTLHDRGQGMAAGTSPSVAGLTGGRIEVAFQAGGHPPGPDRRGPYPERLGGSHRTR